jgi:hypothetical protein
LTHRTHLPKKYLLAREVILIHPRRIFRTLTELYLVEKFLYLGYSGWSILGGGDRSTEKISIESIAPTIDIKNSELAKCHSQTHSPFPGNSLPATPDSPDDFSEVLPSLSSPPSVPDKPSKRVLVTA